MCKKSKFDHTNKWYVHNPSPVLENNTHRLLWDFDIHMDHQISARRPDLIIINNNNNKKKKKKRKKEEKLQNCRLCCPGWPQNKTERMKRRISTSTILGNWKNLEHVGDNYTNCNWCFWYSKLRTIKGPGGLVSWQTCGDHPNDSIIENGQNTEKSPGDLRKLAVTQTPVKDHQLTLLWKTLKE